MKRCILLLFLVIGIYDASQAQVVEEIAKEAVGVLARDFINRALSNDSTDTADPADTVDGDWDEIFRTSDLENERATQHHYDVRYEFPPGKRIGCICMDDTETKEVGKGACSGRGGVRFWIYQQGDSTARYGTMRHRSHPDPLSEEEKANLTAYSQAKKTSFGAGFRHPSDRFYDFAIVLVMCMTIIYIVQTMYGGRNELFR